MYKLRIVSDFADFIWNHLSKDDRLSFYQDILDRLGYGEV